MVNDNMNGPARDRVLSLVTEKGKLEYEIREQRAILASENIGMDEPLVDAEGYPRNDIDVYKVRHARNRIRCLETDIKELMKEIEDALQAAYNRNAPNVNVGPSAASASASTAHRVSSHIPQRETCIAKIEEVCNGSPAHIAGFQDEDEVLQFGSITHSNFRDVGQILDLVAESILEPVEVRVRRGEQVLTLSVIPRPWSWSGLIGCRFTPIPMTNGHTYS